MSRMWRDSSGRLIVDANGRAILCDECPCAPACTIVCDSNPDELMCDPQNVVVTLCGSSTASIAAPYAAPVWEIPVSGTGEGYPLCDTSPEINGGLSISVASLRCIGTPGDWRIVVVVDIYASTGTPAFSEQTFDSDNVGAMGISLVVDSTNPFQITGTFDLADVIADITAAGRLADFNYALGRCTNGCDDTSDLTMRVVFNDPS